MSILNILLIAILITKWIQDFIASWLAISWRKLSLLIVNNEFLGILKIWIAIQQYPLICGISCLLNNLVYINNIFRVRVVRAVRLLISLNWRSLSHKVLAIKLFLVILICIRNTISKRIEFLSLLILKALFIEIYRSWLIFAYLLIKWTVNLKIIFLWV